MIQSEPDAVVEATADKIDVDLLVETTGRLTELLRDTRVTRLAVSAGPLRWELETAPSVVAEGAVTVAARAAPAVETPEPDRGHPVTAPLVGVFYSAPSPAAPPFVEVGQRVTIGGQLAIVEAMKLMNAVTSPVDGVVREIHVANGDIVEFGEKMFTIDPVGG